MYKLRENQAIAPLQHQPLELVALLEKTPAAIASLDPEHCYLSVKRVIEQAPGITPNE